MHYFTMSTCKNTFASFTTLPLFTKHRTVTMQKVPLLLLAALAASLFPTPCRSAGPPIYDLVIYGGTSAGIAAAVQAKRMGASVIVLEPSARIGGLTSGDLDRQTSERKQRSAASPESFINASGNTTRMMQTGTGNQSGLSQWWTKPHDGRRGHDVDIRTVHRIENHAGLCQ